ncbi:MAG: hypothetical protein H0V66_03545 [Bdellovibrionales bacterium]|nr:hypothetical protein [Bdellovibrionales bacterium]
MKKLVTFLALSLVLMSSAFAKIVLVKNQYFINSRAGEVPMSLVNTMIKNNTITNINLYGNGNVHLISYSTKNGPVKLYSVDEKGFTYAIEPFSSYSVSSTEPNGKFSFNEVPGRKYTVNSKGFFLY